MKKVLICWASIVLAVDANAEQGPTAVGSLSIGMNKSEYIAAIGISPVNCNTFKDKDGKVLLAAPKSLSVETKHLCYDFRIGRKTGTVETVQVINVSYDVVQADYESSKLVQSLGNSSKAIFVQDKLISLEIYSPKVTLEALASKYGAPKVIDKSKIETCQNRIGNEFRNQIGNIDAVWTNGDVNAVLRTAKRPPRNTCTDNYEMQYYIIEDRKQVALIESAILRLKEDLSRQTVKESPF